MKFQFKSLKLFQSRLNRYKILNCSKGLTLIETIIYVAIIGGIIGAFVSFTLSVSDSNNKTYAVQEVQANARVVLDIVTHKIQFASGVNVASSTFGINPGVLFLYFASSTLNPTVIQLSQDDGVLQITEGVGSPTSITSNEVSITNLVFTNLTGDSDRENIKMELTVGFTNNESQIFDYSQSLQTSVSVRN